MGRHKDPNKYESGKYIRVLVNNEEIMKERLRLFQEKIVYCESRKQFLDDYYNNLIKNISRYKNDNSSAPI